VVIKLSTLTDISLALDQQGVKHIASIGQMLRLLRLQLEPTGVAKSCTPSTLSEVYEENWKIARMRVANS